MPTGKVPATLVPARPPPKSQWRLTTMASCRPKPSRRSPLRSVAQPESPPATDSTVMGACTTPALAIAVGPVRTDCRVIGTRRRTGTLNTSAGGISIFAERATDLSSCWGGRGNPTWRFRHDCHRTILDAVEHLIASPHHPNDRVEDRQSDDPGPNAPPCATP
jgi:hypothetical protein